jgi:hypothetical protein
MRVRAHTMVVVSVVNVANSVTMVNAVNESIPLMGYNAVNGSMQLLWSTRSMLLMSQYGSMQLMGHKSMQMHTLLMSWASCGGSM